MTDHKLLRQTVLGAWKRGCRERNVIVAGTSMKPLIHEGCRLTFSPLEHAERLCIGDIAVFHCGTSLIAHRIIGKQKRPDGVWFLEKGDNNFYPGRVAASAIIGKVIRIDDGAQSIDLNRWHWRTINRLVGWYWKSLFTTIAAALRIRNILFRDRRLGTIGRVYHGIIQFALKLPTFFLRFK